MSDNLDYRRNPLLILDALALFLIIGGMAAAADLTWAPGPNNNWDYYTANWMPGPTTYADGDSVTFDDSVGANQSVTLTWVSPGNITLANSVYNYAFIGGGFTAAGSTTKTGTGVVTITSAGATIDFGTKLDVQRGLLILDSATFQGRSINVGNGVGTVGALSATGGAQVAADDGAAGTFIGCNGGAGTLNLSPGTSLIGGTANDLIAFGDGAGSNATAALNGATINCFAAPGGWLKFGANGSTNLTIVNASYVNSGQGMLMLGWNDGASGSAGNTTTVVMGTASTPGHPSTDACVLNCSDTYGQDQNLGQWGADVVGGGHGAKLVLTVNGKSKLTTDNPTNFGSGATWVDGNGAAIGGNARITLNDQASIQTGLSGVNDIWGNSTSWGATNYVNQTEPDLYNALVVTLNDYATIVNKNSAFSICYSGYGTLNLNGHSQLTEDYAPGGGVLNIGNYGGAVKLNMTGDSSVNTTAGNIIWMGMWTSTVTAVLGTPGSEDTCNITSGSYIDMAFSGGHINLTLNGKSYVSAAGEIYMAREEQGGFPNGTANLVMNDDSHIQAQGLFDFSHGDYWAWHPDIGQWVKDPLPQTGSITMRGTSHIDVGLNGAADQTSNIGVVAGSSATIDMSGGSWIHNSNQQLVLGSEGGVAITMKDTAAIKQLKAGGAGIQLGGWTGTNSLTMQDGTTLQSATDLIAGWNGAITTIVAGRPGNLADQPAISCGGNLTLGADSGGHGTITLNGRSSLTVGGISRIGAGSHNLLGGANGIVTLNDSTTATFTGRVALGSNDAPDPSTPVGTLTLNDSSIVDLLGGIDVGANGAVGSAINVQSGLLTVRDVSSVAFGSSITVRAGGTLTSTADLTNDGVMTVAGTATLTNLLGTGSLDVRGSGLITAASITQSSLSIGGPMPPPLTAVPEPATLTLLAFALVLITLRSYSSRSA